MRKTVSAILVCLLMLGITPAVAGTVTVSFVHPETYTDASLSGGYGVKAEEWTLGEIGRHLESLGGRLGPQQVLTLDVRYRLAEGGRTLLEGQETVVDPNYLANPARYFTPSPTAL
jgi:hypothetical protein